MKNTKTYIFMGREYMDITLHYFLIIWDGSLPDLWLQILKTRQKSVWNLIK